MPAPTSLSIATSSVLRLVKEESSYHKELEQQKRRVEKLEGETGGDDDGNREFILKQEVCFTFFHHFNLHSSPHLSYPIYIYGSIYMFVIMAPVYFFPSICFSLLFWKNVAHI